MTQVTQIDQRWQLSGDVDIGTISTVLNTSNALSIQAGTTVDFAEVANIDTATISLILEWKRRAARENQSIKFVNLPANLISLTQLYGVSELIN